MITNAIITGLILNRFAVSSFHVIFGMLAVGVACSNVDITGFSEKRLVTNCCILLPRQSKPFKVGLKMHTNLPPHSCFLLSIVKFS